MTQFMESFTPHQLLTSWTEFSCHSFIKASLISLSLPFMHHYNTWYLLKESAYYHTRDPVHKFKHQQGREGTQGLC